jgi:hypothetical protein
MTRNIKQEIVAVQSVTLDAIRQRIDELTTKMHDESQRLFEQYIKEYFDRHPRVNAFYWKQYTPGFNDGDECIFRAEQPSLKFDYPPEEHTDLASLEAGDDIEWDEDTDRCPETSVCYYKSNSYAYADVTKDPEIDLAKREAETLLEYIGDDILRHMFGDCVQVVVEYTGVTVLEIEAPY